MNSVGIEDKSIFSNIYTHLFYSFQDNLFPIREFADTDRWRKEKTFEDFIRELFSQRTLDKILEAEKTGKKVYMGRLHSDSDINECFFCTDAFIIDTEELYIDASNAGW
ncbi:hypothetical protein HMPREF9449_01313 [Odoribacter laneus YIT 12061]|uniref:Uncharacterized protein n=2 Tax=Odoribacter laneus TaxID=626933 RepID=H1DGC7_9BACT|nr:hypothetical protein HMPREF9449_01313 [Odoribacter laneus YIT 12061]